MLEKFLITNGNYDTILANPTRLAENNITKIYLRNRNLSLEMFRAFLKLQSTLKNIEIFVNHSQAPEILAHTHIHLKGDELHLVRELKGLRCLDLQGESTSDKSAKILSYSAHSLSDILKAHEAGIDYIFISPIFAVADKNAPLGLEIFTHIPHAIKPKIFALGGINSHNIHLFESLGIRGVAGIRAFGRIFGL